VVADKIDIGRASNVVAATQTLKLAARCPFACGEHFALANRLGLGVCCDRRANCYCERQRQQGAGKNDERSHRRSPVVYYPKHDSIQHHGVAPPL
jgi:hypothetical protein